MNKGDRVFSAIGEDPVITVHSAGVSATDSPRHHVTGSGFLFEYVLSGEECIESPNILENAEVGTFVVIHPSEECVIYRKSKKVSAIHIQISGFLLEAVAEVLSLPRVFCGRASSDLLHKFMTLDDLYKKYSAGSGNAGKRLCEIAFSLLLEAASAEPANIQLRPTAERIKDYLDLCLCGDVDLDSIGKKFGITGMHVIRLFRNEYDETPMQYLKISRLKKSAEFLKNTNMTIKEISSMLQFSSTQHFTNLFRDHFGISPGKYREG